MLHYSNPLVKTLFDLQYNHYFAPWRQQQAVKLTWGMYIYILYILLHFQHTIRWAMSVFILELCASGQWCLINRSPILLLFFCLFSCWVLLFILQLVIICVHWHQRLASAEHWAERWAWTKTTKLKAVKLKQWAKRCCSLEGYHNERNLFHITQSFFNRYYSSF